SLAPLVKSYTAVELSSTMLDIARKRADELRVRNVIFAHCALQEFVPCETYDIIYLSGVSQYLHDNELKAVVRRLNLALKPGGVIVDRSTLHRFHRSVRQDDEYFSIYRTGDEVRQMFADEGFINCWHKA